MATYYVRNDGNNANTGLGPNANQAWQTIQWALRTGSPVSGGDTVYIAPGRYAENITVAMSSPSSEVLITGNPTSSQFADVPPGIIRLTNCTSDATIPVQTVTLFLCTSKNNLRFEYIFWESYSRYTDSIVFTNCSNLTFRKCIFQLVALETRMVINCDSLTSNITFDSNITHAHGGYPQFNGSSGTSHNVIISRNLFLGQSGIKLAGTLGQVYVYNNTVAVAGAVAFNAAGLGHGIIRIYNNILMWSNSTIINVSTAGVASGNYNRYGGDGGLFNYTAASNDRSGVLGLSFGAERLFGIGTNDFYAPYFGSANYISGEPLSSSVSVTSGVADIPMGGNTYVANDRVQFTTTLGNLVSTNTYTISSVTGTTSFVLSGVTPTISGTIRHSRLRSSVDVYDTPWDSTTTPNVGALTQKALSTIGQYLPSERQSTAVRLVPGSTNNSLTVFLGATGLVFNTPNLFARYIRNNGASVSVPLVSQTIGGAWVAGGFCEVDPVNLPGFYRFDLPNEAIANYTTALSIAIKGAVGTNGAYITAELEQSTTLISTTGYKLISDQLGANGALDVIKGSSITVKLQITDVNQKPVPIGSATCTVQVYSLNNLVATYPVVVQYQSNGEMTFVLDTAVTTAPGSYNIYVNRNNGGSDTVVYGPMKLTVSNL